MARSLALGPRDWLLMLLDGALDPIRIQKGMFLFAMESKSPPREVYAFEAYNWGPLSKRIYVDLEGLIADGLVERVPVPGQSYSLYRQADSGATAAAELAQRADSNRLAALGEIRKHITTLSFNDLLQDVYSRYPKYASKSMFRAWAE